MFPNHKAIVAFAYNEPLDHRYDIFCITDPDIQGYPIRKEMIGDLQMSLEMWQRAGEVSTITHIEISLQAISRQTYQQGVSCPTL
jgi:5S rRNA maturation endonuclease (ribonuclease M5)